MGKNPIVRNGDNVLLAYSGGISSSALLHLIIQVPYFRTCSFKVQVKKEEIKLFRRCLNNNCLVTVFSQQHLLRPTH